MSADARDTQDDLVRESNRIQNDRILNPDKNTSPGAGAEEDLSEAGRQKLIDQKRMMQEAANKDRK